MFIHRQSPWEGLRVAEAPGLESQKKGAFS